MALCSGPPNRAEEDGMTIKKLVLAALAATFGMSATAGGPAEPAMEPDTVEQGAGIDIPSLLRPLIAAAVSGSDHPASRCRHCCRYDELCRVWRCRTGNGLNSAKSSD
jgi:hypothetical protein